jgi:hypothetical protein
MNDRPEFPEMIRRFGGEPEPSVWDTLAPRRGTPGIPNTPGVYIIDQPSHHNTPGWWYGSAHFRRDTHGYWQMDAREITIDELVTIVGHGELVELVPRSETDK